MFSKSVLLKNNFQVLFLLLLALASHGSLWPLFLRKTNIVHENLRHSCTKRLFPQAGPFVVVTFLAQKPSILLRTSLPRLKKHAAKPLFVTVLFFVRRRGGLDVSFSKPSRLSSKTPRFFDVKFCAQARYLRGVVVISPTPVRKNETPKNEGLGL